MTETSTSTESIQYRLVRVFVSSTFRDMYAEREELLKRIFPELRRRCRPYFIGLLGERYGWCGTYSLWKEGQRRDMVF